MTPDEATEALYKAIVDHAVALDIAEPDVEMLNNFAIVAHWQKIEVGDGRSRYTNQFHSEGVPAHVAVGLLHIGLDILVDRSEE